MTAHTQRSVSMSRRTYITVVVLCLGLLNGSRVFAQADSQPPPFDGPWDSRLKLTGDWGGARDQLCDHGITLEEYTPFGLVAAITPSTHSIPTLSGNIINIVAAGNAVVFNAHPGAAKCAALAVRFTLFGLLSSLLAPL